MPIQLSGSLAVTGSITTSTTINIADTTNPVSFTSTASFYSDGGARFTKDMFVSGTAYFNNVTVYGTQSVCFITSSQLNISNNLISVNTATPTVRFGGLAVYDSGSTGLTGSILWDSENNHWIYSNPSGSSYSGGMFISGPRTSTLGSETGTTSCMLLAGQGGDHLTSSAIYHSSTVTCIPNTLIGSTICSSTTCAGTAVFGNTGAGSFSLSITNNDQSNARIRLTNTGTGGGIFSLVAGNPGASNAGLAIYDENCSATRVYINSAGSVGIGTSSPSATFHVNAGAVSTPRGGGFTKYFFTSNNASATYFELQTTGSATTNDILFSQGSTGNYGIIGYDQLNDTMRVYTSSNIRFKIDGSGIACFSCQVCVPNIISTGVSGGRYATFNAPTNGGYITFEAGGTPFGDLGSYCAQYGTGDATTLLLGSRTGYALALGTNSTERLRITCAGNVGIGTSTPATKLHVSNNGAYGIEIDVANEIIQAYNRSTSDYNEIKLYSSNIRFFNGGSATITERMRITSDGQILMGTTSAQSGTRLQVAGVLDVWSSANTLLRLNHDGTRGVIETFTGGGYAPTSINPNGGNVGIGTTNPTQQLETTARFVIGNAVTGRVGTFGQATATADTYITIQNTIGNFDIGTSSGGHYFYGIGSLPLQFYTNSTEKMRITSGGSVFIGNTGALANEKFSVQHTNNCALATVPAVARFMNNGSGYIPKILITDNNIADATISFIPAGAGTSTLSFGIQGICVGYQYLNIKENGNIGIGTISPNSPLHIITSTGISSTSALRIRQTNSTDRTTRIQLEDYNASIADGLIDFVIPTAGSSTGARLSLGVNSTSLHIVNGGQVGIGTTSTSAEANLFLGARTTIEGGQMVFQKGTSCSCATHLDNYADSFRVLVGDDTGTNGVHMLIDHKTRNACFYGSMLRPTLDTFIQSCYFSLPASTSRVITLCGTTNGFVQINLGMYGNGTGNQARGMWMGGGYLGGSNLAYSELVRIGQTFLCVGTITSNATSTQLVVGNCFNSNSADVTFLVMSGTANQTPINIFVV